MNPTKSCKTCGVPKHPDTFYLHSPGVLANECKSCKKKRNERHKVLKRYGISVEEWREVRALGCSVCGSTNRVVLDHDHNTNKIRGPLCDLCNRGLGFFRDSPALLSRAIEYLEGGMV